MINLELTGKHRETLDNLRQVAEHMMRPYSRKYDKAEHSYPKEMEEVAKIIASARPAASVKSAPAIEEGVRNGANLMTVTAYVGQFPRRLERLLRADRAGLPREVPAQRDAIGCLHVPVAQLAARRERRPAGFGSKWWPCLWLRREVSSRFRAPLRAPGGNLDETRPSACDDCARGGAKNGMDTDSGSGSPGPAETAAD